MVPEIIAKAMPLGVLAAQQTHGKAALVSFFGSGAPGSLDKWFLPMPPHSVLAQIQAFVTHYTAQHGVKPNHVIMTPQEHTALQNELGAKGHVAMVQQCHIYVKPGESDLPKPVDMAPDLTAAKDVAPVLTDFATMEDLLHPKTLQPPIEAPLTFPTHPIFPFPKPSPTKEDAVFGYGYTETDKYIVGMDEGEDEDPDGPDHPNAWKGPGFELQPPAPKPKKVYHKSTSDEHGTPQALFDVLDQEFHFDLDVCATGPVEVPGDTPDFYSNDNDVPMVLDPGNAKCPIYFTAETDGLKMDWFGTVWMNPPYTKGQVKTWIGKLVKEMLLGHLDRAVALVAARPDTQWFQFAASYAYEIRFLTGRLTFEGSKDPAPFPSAVLLFDRKKTVQVIRFWDWKKKQAVKYFNVMGAAGGALGSAHGVIPQAPSLLAYIKKKGILS